MIPIPAGWSVVLDLGRDLSATELDAAYVHAALVECGVPAVVSPWHPAHDAITPLGCTRPYKVVVPVSESLDARELVEDVLASRTGRYEVLLPADDVWALRYQVSALVLPLLRLSRIDDSWLFILWLLRLYLSDTAHAHELQSDGTYKRRSPAPGDDPIDAQGALLAAVGSS